MACTTGNDVTLKQISWENFTPLLVKAEKIRIKKMRIDAKGMVTEDTRNWVLSDVEWRFAPTKDPEHIMRISTVDAKGQPEANPDTEEFDFLSGAFKFYYNEKENEIFGEIEVLEGGFNVTYRYEISFYGSQTVAAKDLLVSQSVCTANGVRSINSVIAL